MKHTPAPWEVKGPTIYGPPFTDGAPDTLIAVITTTPRSGDEEANARLIAAAPVMYGALKAREAYRYGWPTPWGHACAWCGDCKNKLEAMEAAAIAKATTDDC